MPSLKAVGAPLRVYAMVSYVRCSEVYHCSKINKIHLNLFLKLRLIYCLYLANFLKVKSQRQKLEG